MLGCDLFFICLAEKIYFANLIKETKPSVSDITKGNMDVSEIHIMQKYKNFAELCRKLNVPNNLKGKQRQNQIKKIQKIFYMEKNRKRKRDRNSPKVFKAKSGIVKKQGKINLYKAFGISFISLPVPMQRTYKRIIPN